MTAYLDGALVAASALPTTTAAVAPFETMGAVAAALPLWPQHLARLGAAAARLGRPWVAAPELRAAASALLLQNGCADGVLRLQLWPAAAGWQVAMTTRPRGLRPRVVQLLPTVVERLATDPPGDLKASPRRFYDRVRQQAQDGGADDGIVVGSDGAVLETAVGNLWLWLDGEWVTPTLDGRVLPGVARALLLAAAANGRLRVREQPCGLDDLHRARLLAVSNAVHGPEPAGLLGAEPGEVSLVEELRRCWREALAAGG